LLLKNAGNADSDALFCLLRQKLANVPSAPLCGSTADEVIE